MAQSFLQIDNLTKSYGDRLLFADVTFGVYEGDKIGVIAKNGTGKSTLLRIISGAESADSGAVVMRSGLRVGMLDQEPRFPDGATVLEACLADDTPACRAIRAYELASACPDDGETLQNAIQQMDAAHAWAHEDLLRQLLDQLRITDLSQPASTLSGGQAKRVALARLIMGEPDLIILDEPTNHLDIDVVEWLENYLGRQRITLLMVTHDRYFLDRVTNKIIEIDNRTIYTYEGNYDEYLRRRSERIEAMDAELARTRNTLRREQEWMRRQPQARAGKAKYRIDNFYRLQQRRQELSGKEQNLELDIRSSYIGSKIFEASHVSKAFGDKVILSDFNYVFARYERMGVIGPNGAGKSTFIKMLQGIVAPDSGRFDVGETVRFGYYSQDGISFNPQEKVIDAVTRMAEDIVFDEGAERYTPMQFLTRFLFSPADQQKYISTLSGGERARLHLATVLMRQPNFLILDEPTNDLDIVTLGILEEYLESFSGCLIVVSHDRFFLDSIVDHLLVLEGGGRVEDFPGGYTDYRRAKAEREAAEAASRAEEKPRDNRPRRQDTERPAKMTFKERREFEGLTAEIDSLTAEKAALDSRFQSPAPDDDLATMSARYSEISELLDEKEMRWLELSEKA